MPQNASNYIFSTGRVEIPGNENACMSANQSKYSKTDKNAQIKGNDTNMLHVLFHFTWLKYSNVKVLHASDESYFK